jgi:phosphoglycolate phosphatase
MIKKKLVLFDIDGTLIYHVGPRKWEEQYMYGMKVAYGVDMLQDPKQYNGNVEMQMAWEIMKSNGISKDEFLQKYPQYIEAMIQHLHDWGKRGPVFKVIETAKNLAQMLSINKKYALGVLTGNAKKIAIWKLEHTGLSHLFPFGLYGDVADNRIELAKTVFSEAKNYFHTEFSPQDIVVIGDTVHDIRCGKAIGAVTIAVTTGMHADPDVLEAEKPDILATSLMDPAVITYFHL